ncbi:MAG: histidinol-phosphatase HisJ family protein [Desulfotomaculaceae bacterium]|nr:histidinol-phosphatase HisJ family protein [Desulfotomaculaceae bacterium]
MIVDYHIHTKMCGHATGELEEYLAVANRQGLEEIGFADHLPLYFLPPDSMLAGYAMTKADLPVYVDAVQRLQKKGPVRVKLGVEADYVPGFEGELEKLLKAYPFDYVIGSVHFIDGWSFDNQEEIDRYSQWDIWELYERYFTLVRQAAMSGLFDIMAHPDLIKKFNYLPSRDLMPLYEDTVQVFKKAGVCVEVNAAGLRYPVREIYPAQGFLKAAFRQGLTVSLGSDAHQPELVGAGLAEAVALIKATGYSEITTFEHRNRVVKNIY